MSQAPFIIGAYVIAFVALAGLVAFSLIDRYRVRREIVERGLERKRSFRNASACGCWWARSPRLASRRHWC